MILILQTAAPVPVSAHGEEAEVMESEESTVQVSSFYIT